MLRAVPNPSLEQWQQPGRQRELFSQVLPRPELHPKRPSETGSRPEVLAPPWRTHMHTHIHSMASHPEQTLRPPARVWDAQRLSAHRPVVALTPVQPLFFRGPARLGYANLGEFGGSEQSPPGRDVPLLVPLTGSSPPPSTADSSRVPPQV